MHPLAKTEVDLQHRLPVGQWWGGGYSLPITEIWLKATWVHAGRPTSRRPIPRVQKGERDVESGGLERRAGDGEGVQHPERDVGWGHGLAVVRALGFVRGSE